MLVTLFKIGIFQGFYKSPVTISVTTLFVLEFILKTVSFENLALVEDVLESVNLISNEPNRRNIPDLISKKLSVSLYAIFSDDLKPKIDSSFGTINNSVWQVIEALAYQYDHMLSDLVLTINSDKRMVDGLHKFNAFIFGLIKYFICLKF